LTSGHQRQRTADRYGHLYQGNNQDADAIDRLLKRA
jgi:hypothetical protein